MTFLVLPVYHLGGREGQCPSAHAFDFFCKLVGDHVEPVIDLTVMVQIKKGRSVRQCLKDARGDQETEGDRIRIRLEDVIAKAKDLPVVAGTYRQRP